MAHGLPQGVPTECHTLFVLATDDVRLFAFVRFTTGDAMSKRSKFALITWIGEDVSGLQRAKTGTDKTLVKEVVQVLSSAARQQGSPCSWGQGGGWTLENLNTVQSTSQGQSAAILTVNTIEHSSWTSSSAQSAAHRQGD